VMGWVFGGRVGDCLARGDVVDGVGMRRLLFFGILGLACGIGEGSLEKASELVAGKQYLTAYELIEKTDEGGQDLEAVLMRHEILTRYYVNRINREFFALRNLGEDERIEDVRGGEGSFQMFHFDVIEAFGGFLKKHPDDPRLRRVLGMHHYHLFSNGEDAGDSANDGRLHLEKALAGGLDDDAIRFAMGHLEMAAGNLVESIAHFEKCLGFDPDHASANFNLASARLETGAMREALEPALRAVELYADAGLKSDAASMAGFIHEQLGHDEEALRHYGLADELRPNAYPNIAYLLAARVRLKDARARATALRVMELDPENPTVFQLLEEAYVAAEQGDELILLYHDELNRPAGERSPRVMGNLHFYLARLHMEQVPTMAVKHFKAAREIYAVEFADNHAVLGIIDEFLREHDE
jgi:tetratricopeptide (TPR) repeat protein